MSDRKGADLARALMRERQLLKELEAVRKEIAKDRKLIETYKRWQKRAKKK